MTFLEDFELGGLWAGVVWRCSTFATAAQSISSGNPNLAVNGSRALLTSPAQISDSVSLKGPTT